MPPCSSTTVRALCPCSLNSMLSPPPTGSRSSLIVGAYAIAVPVAAHLQDQEVSNFLFKYVSRVNEVKLTDQSWLGSTRLEVESARK